LIFARKITSTKLKFFYVSFLKIEREERKLLIVDISITKKNNLHVNGLNFSRGVLKKVVFPSHNAKKE